MVAWDWDSSPLLEHGAFSRGQRMEREKKPGLRAQLSER